MRRIGSAAIIGAMVAGLAFATPTAAQQRSEGAEFLKAVKDRDGDKVTTLLDKPGSTAVNARDITSGESGLHLVIARRDAVWLRYLLGRGANPNVTDKKGTAPLQLAANLGWNDGVQILVERGANVDAPDQTGETPLIAAIHRRDTEAVRVLLKAGANPDRSDNSGRTARDYAALLGPQSAIMTELDKAREERKARAAKSYGPGS